MALKLSNNGVSRLSGSITSTATTLNLQPGDGILFPALDPGDWFPLTLVKTGAFEIVRVTARATDSLTITRAQEGTLATSFSAGDRVELRMTALAYQSFVPDLTWASISGKPTFATVATSGSYNDLLDKPVAPTYSAVASSGQYADLLGKPTLGTAAAKNFGTAAGNLVEVQTGGKLPALDGSALTGLNAIPIGTVMHIAASSAPAGFLAVAAVYAIATYATLAAALGAQPDTLAITQPAKSLTGVSTGTDAAYGAGRWIVVGTSNQACSSDDGGLTWTARSTGIGAYGIAYGGGRWVAVGNGATRYSTDGGVTWNSGGSGGWLGRTLYNNGIFVSLNILNYTVYSSPDSITWTSRVAGDSTTQIATVGTGFVAAGVSMQYSANGTTWAARTGSNFQSIAGSTDGVLVAIMSLDPNSDGVFENYMFRSTDTGQTWQAVTDAPVLTGTLGYANGLFYISPAGFGTTTVIYTSPDGLKWKKYTFTLSPAPAGGMTQKFSNGKILAIAAATAYPMSDMSYDPAVNFYVPDYQAYNNDPLTKAYIRAT